MKITVTNNNQIGKVTFGKITRVGTISANDIVDIGPEVYDKVNAAYGQANAAYASANAAANTVAVYANDTIVISKANINFNNSSSLNVSVAANNTTKRANVSFAVNTNPLVLRAGDTMTGNLNVAATIISQNIIPNLNVTYDLGTVTQRFKDLYLSGNSLYLGDTIISSADGELRSNVFNAAVAVLVQGESLLPKINAAYEQANTGRLDANSTFATINATFANVNTTFATVNSTFATMNATFANVNTTFATLNTSAGLQNTAITNAHNQANAAYAEANIKLNLTGGVLSGDLTVAGNLIVSGNSTTLNTEILVVEDADIVLLSNVTSTPALNAGITINRGTSSNTFLRWNESTDKWGWSDDGSAFYSFDTALNAYAQANTAYAQANAARSQANTAYAQANAAYAEANVKVNIAGGSITGTLNVASLNVNANASIYETLFVNTAITTGGSNGTISGVNTIYASTFSSNGVNVTAQAANAYGQANAAYAQANLAYAQANAARSDANTTFATINATFANVNTTFSTINSTFATLNTSANSQNTAITTANDQANTARDTANAAYAQANTVYAAANLVYLPSVTRLAVTSNATIGYQFDQYGSGINNPNVYVRAGETLAFSLDTPGHPFNIRVSSGGANYNSGLVHVAANGATVIGANAQGQTSGTLYWKVPYQLGGNSYVYQCSVHSGMVGNVIIEHDSTVIHAQANVARDQANTARTTANDAYAQANTARDQANTARDQANTAYGQANNAYAQANLAYDQANTGYTQANAAYSQANTARDTANSAYGQANLAYSQANTAYGQANDAFTQANAARSQANSAYGQANTAYAQANAAYNDSNTRVLKSGDTMTGNLQVAATTITQHVIPSANITYNIGSTSNRYASVHTSTIRLGDALLTANGTALSVDGVVIQGSNIAVDLTSSYNQANTARDTANAAYAQANTARDTANAAYGQANLAYAQANAARSDANTTFATINSTFATVNTLITTANTQANAARLQANSAYDQANLAYNQANTGYAQANDAYGQANAAYTQANAARSQANTAYTQANNAYAQANAAYAEANLKLNLTGGTINGSLNISGNLVITGNTTFVNANSYVVNDPLIFLGANNIINDVLDIGFIGAKNTGSGVTHTGLARDAGDATWYLFDNLVDSGHENNIVDFANTTLATLRANIIANSIVLLGNTVATQANLTIAHNQANTAYGQANAARDQANTAYGQANLAYTQANTARDTANSAYAQANTARDTANAAYGQANLAYTQANAARDQANTAYTQANTARDTGNNAYAQANAAYGQANLAYTAANNRVLKSGDTMTGNLNVAATIISQNIIPNLNVTYNIGTTTNVYSAIHANTIMLGGASITSNGNALVVSGVQIEGSNIAFDISGAYNQANAARSQANTAYAQANAAYAQANAARSDANTTFATVNSTFSTINSTFGTVNTLVTTANTQANLARDTANSAYGQANLAYTQANTAYGQANLAYSQANTAYGQANAAYSQANSAYSQANAAYSQANSAYGQANLAYTQANNAYAQANLAYAQANTANNTANAAYNQANSNYQPAVTRLDVSTSGSSAFLFDQYSGNSPTIYVRAGESLAFSLNTAGHPFMIRTSSGGSNYSNGLTHVSNTGTVTYTSSAQGKESGTLYWKVPYELQGNTYVYQCSVHAGMVGNIVIEPPMVVAYDQANNAYAQANLAYTQANNAYAKANSPITVKEIYVSNSTVVNTYTNINTIQFDSDSGMAVVNAAANTVTIQLNSTFKNWNVDGNTGLVAVGLDTVNFIAGSGMTITANNSNTPKSIIFSSTGGGGGGSALTIKDEGTNLNTAVTSINFVGEGVTATANGSNITVTINNGGSGIASVESDVFSANGVQNTFTLTAATTTDRALVYISGVAQVPVVDYQVSGTTLSFNAAPLSGTTVEVRSLINDGSPANTVRVSQNSGSTLSAKQLNFVNTANVTITVTDSGDGNANVAIFSAAGGGGSALTIKDDGTSLNTSVSTIDFVGTGVTATANGNNVTVTIPAGLSNTIVKTTSYTANNAAANLTYSLPVAPISPAYLFVIKNGVVLTPNTDYSVSNTTLTVIESGSANDVIEVRYFDQINVYESANTLIEVTSNVVAAQTNTFTLANVTAINRLAITKNGLQLTPNLHYSINTSSNTVTLDSIAEIGDILTFTNFRNVNDIAGGGGLVQYTYNTSTSSIETVDQWSKSTYRSAKYQMQVESGSGYQAVDIMVIHDGVDTNTIQYGSSTFGANVGVFTSDISGSNVRLRFTATDATSYLTYYKTILASRASESLPTDLMTGSDTYDLLVTLPFHPTDLN